MNQIELNNEKKFWEGITTKELLALATEEMICSNSKTLKELLNEALSHKVIYERTDDKG